MLHRIVAVAVELVGATYGALGLLDHDRTHLSDFITIGIEEHDIEAIGDLPKGHGILGLLILEPQALRLTDLTEHADHFGFPLHHPTMHSFLGVPIFVRGEAYGNLYLTGKRDGVAFTEVDEELVVGLATAASVAIENARLHARVREVDLLEERERIARDLHDTVIQRMFTIGLSLQGAARLAERPEVVERIDRAVDEIDTTVRELRSSIFELMPVSAASTGVRAGVRAIVDELAGALGFSASLRFDGPVDTAIGGDVGADVLAVVRETLTNVARHANARAATVVVSAVDGEATVLVSDDGTGPGPLRGGGHGLDNLRERAAGRGGRFDLAPAAHGGTIARWSVPLAT